MQTQAKETAEAPPRVMIMDDDAGFCAFASQTLQRQGWSVWTASDGRSALNALLQNECDAVLVDLMMEGMDGFTFLQEARKIWPHLGLVVCSGLVDEPALERLEREGIRRILQKPVTPEQIIEQLAAEVAQCRADQRLAAKFLSGRLDLQLSVLRDLGKSAVQARSVSQALRTLGASISQMLPCDALGILGHEDQTPFLLLLQRRALSPPLIEALRQEVFSRYEALAKQTLNAAMVREEHDGPEATEAPMPLRFGSINSIPIILNGAVHGVLVLASLERHAFSESDIAFLYQAVNQLSNVLIALNQIRHLALRDPGTGVYNHRYMEEQLQQFVQMSQRYKYPTGLLLVEVDRFEEFTNPAHPGATDALLGELAQFLRRTTRGSDVIARLGGARFAILMPRGDAIGAGILAERLCRRAREGAFTQNQRKCPLTVAVGGATNQGCYSELAAPDLLRQAARALAEAQEKRGDGFIIWRPTEHATTAHPPGAPAGAPPAKGRILTVDDDPLIGRLIDRFLKKHGFETVVCHTGREALSWLDREAGLFDVLLTDLTMPEMSGLEVMEEAKRKDESLICVVVSGDVNLQGAINLIRKGAYDVVPKPITEDELAPVVQRACDYRRLMRENQRYRESLEEMVRKKGEEVAAAMEELKCAYQLTLETVVAMLDAREQVTGLHSARVRDITLLLAREMGVASPELEEMGRGALMHDIGKLGIPDAILNKGGPLTEDEWKIMKSHPEVGYRFLNSCSFLKTASDIVRSHHEFWDGTGYPQGIKGHAISLGARIFAVVDVYDALRSARSYKQHMSAADALQMIKAQSGTHFDPGVVAAFEKCHAQVECLGWWPD